MLIGHSNTEMYISIVILIWFILRQTSNIAFVLQLLNSSSRFLVRNACVKSVGQSMVNLVYWTHVGTYRMASRYVVKPTGYLVIFSVTWPSKSLWWMLKQAIVLEAKIPGPYRNSKISLYRKMPLKSISRLWGRFNSLDLPVWLRQPAFKLYIWMFNCDLSEAAIQDLKYYRNLGEFFRRQLRPNVRPVDEQNQVVSPSDGKVLHFGRVQGGSLEQIKGMNYSLEGFLGPASWLAQANLTNQNAVGENKEIEEEKSLLSSSAGSSKGEEVYEKQLQIHPDNALYHCVIYLAPGDYHRFHSPTEWKMTYRRHFPGELFSVNPGIARWIQGLFNFNERAIYMGEWEHGFFSLAAVGATNVGSIRVYCDKELSTNTRNKHSEGTFFDAPLSQGTGIAMKRGENLGEFNLGSTIVLVFEAPKSFQFKIESGQKIKYGEPLGDHEV